MEGWKNKPKIIDGRKLTASTGIIIARVAYMDQAYGSLYKDYHGS